MNRRARIVMWLGLFMLGLVACGRAPGDLGGVDLRDPEVGGGVGFPGGETILLTPGLFQDTSPRLDPAEPVVTLPPTVAPSPTPLPAATTAPTPQPESPVEATGEPPPDAVPDTVAPTETSAGDEERIHVVEEGENLYRIGLLYGLSWVVIAEYNGLSDPDQISVGQELRIPPSGEPAEEATPESANPGAVAAGSALETADARPMAGIGAAPEEKVVITSSAAVHIVEPGETLFSISTRYGAIWAQVAEANGLATPNQIYAGQILKIPADIPGPTPVFRHQVHAGETLARIAGQYGVALADLADANGLAAPFVIYRGQLLVIPDLNE